ncbi:hypothetical protein [Nonomuraea sp. NPDC049784]|uniref:hypothetical protein n=1 Tax=Nonomuraea sp. NPDC049784 TaxID=3154361 RepID=UPI0033D9B910
MTMASETSRAGKGRHRERLHVRGVALPSEEWAEFWIADGRLACEPLPGATTVVDGGWLRAYDADPRSEPAVLHTSARVIHRGRIVR